MDKKIEDIEVHLRGVDLELMNLKEVIIKLQSYLINLQSDKFKNNNCFEYSTDSDDSNAIYPPSDED